MQEQENINTKTMPEDTVAIEKAVAPLEESKYITIEDFAKVEIMLGTVISVEEVEGSDKLYKLSVDFGEYNEIENEGGLTEREQKHRIVFSGIKKMVTIENILNKQFPFVTNLAPRKIMGSYSEAMILAGSEGELLALMSPTNILKNGTKLK